MTDLLRPPARPADTSPAPDRLAPIGGPPAALVLPSTAAAIAVLLAALSLSPLFVDGSWFGFTAVVVVSLCLAGAVALFLRAPLFLVPIVQAFVLFCLLVARFSPDAPLGFVPSPDAMAALRSVLADGTHDVGAFAPPVPVHDGLVALTALGMGCVAIVVYVLHVAMRAPVLAGAPLVAVYVVPSLLLDGGAPWWAFVAVAVGWMVLLSSDERVDVVAWGRVLRRQGGPLSSPLSGTSTGALRLGVLGLAAALLLPVLVPALTDAVLGRAGDGTGTGPGGGGSAVKVGLDPTVALKRQLVGEQSDQVMLRYTGPAPTYLRVVVADSYSSETWRAATFDPNGSPAVAEGVPPDPDVPAGTAAAATTRQYVITDDALSSSFLPVPENFTDIKVPGGTWFVDPLTRTVFGEGSRTDGLRWQVSALALDPTPAQLRAAPAPSAVDVTERLSRADIPQAITALMPQVVTNNDASVYDKVVAIQDYLRTNFTYSTTTASQPVGEGGSYLAQFLKDRSGYCQQFAATMALMVQSLGVPARVVVGYTAGTKADDGSYVVHGKDAHAWPEVYFSGVGWVRFEPTPGGSDGNVDVPDYAQQSSSAPSGPGGSTRGQGTSRNDPTKRQKYVDDPGSAAAAALGAATSSTTSADTWRARGLALLVVLGLLAAAVPALWRWMRRRRRLRDQADVEALWDELRDTALDLGLDWPESATPRQAVDRVISTSYLRGDARDAALRLGRATERARYASTPPATEGLADDVGTVRTALLARAERGTRVRATVWPVSLRRREPRD